MKEFRYITGLQHIGIPTSDINKAMEFYISLGFNVALRTTVNTTNENVVFLTLNNLVLELYGNSCLSSEAGAINHFALEVSDIESAYRCLKNMNYTSIESEIQFLPFWENGIKFFLIKGPNGEIIEFCQKL